MVSHKPVALNGNIYSNDDLLIVSMERLTKKQCRDMRNEEKTAWLDHCILKTRTDLELTRNGNLLSEAEILGIAKKQHMTRHMHNQLEKDSRFFHKRERGKKNFLLRSLDPTECSWDPFVDRSTSITKPGRKKTRGKKKNFVSTESAVSTIKSMAPLLAVAFYEYDKSHKNYIRDNKMLFQIGLYFAGMVGSDSPIMDANLTLQFLMSMEEHGIHTISPFISLQLSIFNIWRRNVRSVKTEAWTDKFANGGDNLKKITSLVGVFLESPAIQALRNIVISLVSMRWFDKDMAKKISKIFPMPGRMLIPDALALILNSVGDLMNIITAVLQGAPISKFFFSEDPLRRAIVDGTRLLSRGEFFYFGLPTDGAMCPREFASIGKPIIDTLNFYREKTNPLSSDGRLLADVLSKLITKNREIDVKLSGCNRATPIGLVVEGDPGIGKTTVMNLNYHIFSKVKKRPFDSTQVFHRCMSSKFYEGYDSKAHPYMHFSEVGGKSQATARMCDDEITDEVLSIVDSVAMPLNMAALEKKDCTYCCCEMLQIDTNNPGMHIALTKYCPGAHLRRFIFVRPILKDRYRKKDSSMIDPDVPCDNYYDKWTFRVYLMLPGENRTVHEKILMEGGAKDDVYAYEKLMSRIIYKHIENQRVHLDGLATDPYDDEGTFLGTVRDLEQHVECGVPNVDDIHAMEFLKIANLDDSSRKAFDDEVCCEDDTRFGIVEDVVLDLLLGNYVQNDEDKYDDEGNVVSDSVSTESKWYKLDEDVKVDEEFWIESHTRVKSIGDFINENLPTIKIAPIFVQKAVREVRKDGRKCWPLNHTKLNFLQSRIKFYWAYYFVWLLHPFLAYAQLKEETENYFPTLSRYSRFALNLYRKTYDIGNTFIDVLTQSIHLLLDAIEVYVGFSKTELAIVMFLFVLIYSGLFLYALVVAIFLFRRISLWRLSRVILRAKLKKQWKEFTYRVNRAFTQAHDYVDYLTMKTGFNFKSAAMAGIQCYIGILIGRGVNKIIAALVLKLIPPLSRTTFGQKHVFLAKHKGKVMSMYERDQLVAQTLPRSEASNFPDNREIDERLNAYEDELKCGDANVRINIHKTKIWNTLINKTPSAHQSGNLGLYYKVKKNQRLVHVYNGPNYRVTFCLGIAGNDAIFNEHALFGDEPQVEIAVFVDPNLIDMRCTRRTLVYREDVVRIKDDLILVPLSSVHFRNILDKFPVDDLPFDNAEGIINGTEIMCHRDEFTLDVDDHATGTVLKFVNPTYYNWDEHKDGMCGTAVIVDNGGSYIGGIHSAGSDVNSYSYAIHITLLQLRVALSELHKKKLMPIFSACSESHIVHGVEPHRKSVVYYECLGPLDYFGNIRVPRHSKSKLRHTILHPTIESKFQEVFGYTQSERYLPPLMGFEGSGESYTNPWNHTLRKMAVVKAPLDQRRLIKSVNQIVSKITSNLREVGVGNLQPFTMKIAINGAKEDAYLRRLSSDKAAGFGLSGKKGDHMSRIELFGDILDVPSEYLIEEVLEILDCYRRGECYGPVYCAALKDEVRLESKRKKTRVFYGTPFAYLIVQRMFLMPLYSLMIEHCFAFFTAIGIDMHRDAHIIYNMIETFSSKRFEGDYSAFDTSMPFDVGVGANTIVLQLLQEFGYNDAQLNICAGVLSDALFPFVDYNGEMMCVPGLQPSGKYATAEDNCLRNLLNLVYAWNSHLELRNKSFFDNVLPFTYGDDLLAAVKEEVAESFNAVTFAALLKSEMNLDFTTSDKSDEISPFIELHEMSFLKRNFTFHHTLWRVCAPLHLGSILKSLSWYLRSDYESEVKQFIQTCNSALREIYFHSEFDGPYNDMRAYLEESIHKKWPKAIYSFPSYDELTQDLQLEGHPHWDNIALVSTESESKSILNDERFSLGSLRAIEEESVAPSRAFGRAPKVIEWPQNDGCVINNLITALEARLLELDALYEESKNPFPELSHAETLRHPPYHADRYVKKACDEYFELKSRRDATYVSLKKLKRMRERALSAKTESDVVSEMTKGTVDESVVDEKENLVDVGGSEADELKLADVTVPSVGQKNLLSLEDFFSRPVLLLTQSVALGTNLNLDLDLWTLYLAHPTVRSKMNNYAFLRADINIRFVVSGTNFHFGRFLISGQPLQAWNENLAFLNPLATTANRFMLLSYLSQSKWAKTVDVKENKPLDMQFPMIGPQPVIRLFNKSPLILASADDFDDATDLFHLHIKTLNQIHSVSSSPSNPSFTLYAWLSNVELGAPTGTHLQISTESKGGKLKKGKGGVSDERETGPVEHYATKAAEVAEMLTMIPPMAPFAELAATAGKGIAWAASLFGWSYPTLVDTPQRMRPDPFQNGAQTIGTDTGQRITLDPKQSITMDPRVVSSQVDEMSMAYLCNVESLLDTFTWSHSKVPLSGTMWCIPVNPFIFKRFLVTGSTYIGTPTALSFAASPFEYWRGVITYRLEFVCSAFHRGKALVYFDPNVSQNVLLDGDVGLNKQYTLVVDLQETQDVTIKINWAFGKAWARVLDTNTMFDIGGIGFSGVNFFDYANGFISVMPFTELQSPDDSDISVNVYISSDDMLFNQLNDARIPTSRPNTESKVVMAGEMSPESVDSMNLNESSANTDHIGEFHFGEFPVSFRGLCHRFCGYLEEGQQVVDTSIGGDTFMVEYQDSNYPLGFPTYSGNNPARQPNLITYLRYGYVGMKGGIKHRIGYGLGLQTFEMDRLKVTIVAPDTVTVPINALSIDYQKLLSSMRGTADFVPSTNGGIEFEMPMYTNNLFGIAFNKDPFPSSNTMIDPLVSRDFNLVCSYVNDVSVTSVYVVHDIASAEDFSLLCFQGAPPYQFTVT